MFLGCWRVHVSPPSCKVRSLQHSSASSVHRPDQRQLSGQHKSFFNWGIIENWRSKPLRKETLYCWWDQTGSVTMAIRETTDQLDVICFSCDTHGAELPCSPKPSSQMLQKNVPSYAKFMFLFYLVSFCFYGFFLPFPFWVDFLLSHPSDNRGSSPYLTQVQLPPGVCGFVK